MSFTPIETQEQFDAAISDRLKRDRESYAKRFEGYKSPNELQAITEDYEKRIKALEEAAAATQRTISEKDAKIAEGEKYRADLAKTRIAIEAGLNMKYASRLRGETEAEWKEDAAELAKDFKAAHVTAPIGSPEPIQTQNAGTRKQFADWMSEKMNE